MAWSQGETPQASPTAASPDEVPSSTDEHQELDLSDYRPPSRAPPEGLGLLTSWTVPPLTIPEVRVNKNEGNDTESRQQKGLIVRPSSTGQASVSTTNNEYGLTAQLSRQGASSQGGNLSDVDLVESLCGDAQHQDTQNIYRLDLDSPTSLTSPPEQDGSNQQQLAQEGKINLGYALRRAFVTSKHSDEKELPRFLPADAVDRILTKSAVREELSQCNFEPNLVEKYASKIWNASRYQIGGHDRLKTRRKIFTILVMLGQVSKIEYFIENHISDADLPFSHIFEEEYLYPRECHGKLSKRIKCFQDTNALHYAASFATYQWFLLAPFFQLAEGPDSANKVIHYNLEDQTTLPFIEENSTAEVSGFARVWRVKIHPAHYNCSNPEEPSSNPWFAVKRLHSMRKEDFDQEVKALKRHIHTNNNHLIKLLLTYRWGGNYHLLFPWADENLRTFWKTYMPLPMKSHARALWMARQCAGLAQGIHAIHDNTDMNEETRQLLSISQQDRNWGRHGDLKPENILWFKQDPSDAQNESAMGILKITDFGLTRYHGSATVEDHVPNGFPVSPTYRTPEYDIRKTLSPEYDIWTLGCVLLEFVIWYFRGWEGVDRFSKERAAEDYNEIKEDTYFQLVKIGQPPLYDIGGRLKPSVKKWILELQNDEECSEFFYELLKFTHNSLLRIRPGKRPKSSELKRRLDSMLARCELDASYCTQPHSRRSPKRIMKSTSFLPAAAPVDLSAQKKEQVRESNVPQHTGKVEDFGDGGPEWSKAHNIMGQRSRSPMAVREHDASPGDEQNTEFFGYSSIRKSQTQTDRNSIMSDISSHRLATAWPHIPERLQGNQSEHRPSVAESTIPSSPTSSSRTGSPTPTFAPQRTGSPSVNFMEVKDDPRMRSKRKGDEGERRGSSSSMLERGSSVSWMRPTAIKPQEQLKPLQQETSGLSHTPPLTREASNVTVEETPLTTQQSAEGPIHQSPQPDPQTSDRLVNKARGERSRSPAESPSPGSGEDTAQASGRRSVEDNAAQDEQQVHNREQNNPVQHVRSDDGEKENAQESTRVESEPEARREGNIFKVIFRRLKEKVRGCFTAE